MLAWAVLSACTTHAVASDTAAESPPVSDPGAPCVLVSGGLGDDAPTPVADSPEALAQQVWHDLDLQVTEQLQQALSARGYRVKPFVVPHADTAIQRQAIHRHWRASGCDWLVQVAHTVGEEKGQAYFGYDFTVAALRGPARLVESLFNQRPRFVRDRDNLLNFRAGEVIAPLVKAIDGGGWLAATRRSPP
jgi:hypothetical protein